MQLPLLERTGNLRAMKKAPIPSLARRIGGFTILELMITVAVLAIVVGIGIPSFQDLMRRNRLAEQTNSFVGALAIARSEAVKRGMLVTVCPANDPVDQAACGAAEDWASNGLIIFTDGGAISIVDGDGDDEDDQDNDVIIQRIRPGAPGITVRNEANMNLISYRGDGGLNLPPGGETRFIIAPEKCRGDLGARSIQLIAAGRASTRKIDCPADNDD